MIIASSLSQGKSRQRVYCLYSLSRQGCPKIVTREKQKWQDWISLEKKKTQKKKKVEKIMENQNEKSEE